nr:MAG TPA: hypothetical protein [Caudoviricetes sp.]
MLLSTQRFSIIDSLGLYLELVIFFPSGPIHSTL